MAEQKRSKSATARMDGARAAKTNSVTRELLWAAIGARLWPSFLTRPRVAQQAFPWLLCLETPEGRLVYRLTDEEAQLFDYLPTRDNDGEPHSDKYAVLHTLAVEGW